MSRTGMGKRLLAMLAAAVMAASLASCADGGNTSGDTSKSPSASGGESGIGERAPDLKYEGRGLEHRTGGGRFVDSGNPPVGAHPLFGREIQL